MLLIGIDEAGYGPRIGPLCHGYSAFRCADSDPAPPDLWKLLHPAVTRHPARDGSLAIDDSKKIYSPAAGISSLQRGVQAFLECFSHAAGAAASTALFERVLPREDREKLERDAWGRAAECETAPVPASAKASATSARPRKYRRASNPSSSPALRPENIPPLGEALARANAAVLALGARALSARDFNTLLQENGNKADLSWNVIARELEILLALAQPNEAIHATIDRQGGRKFYAGRISGLFGGAMAWTETETARRSVYRIENGARCARIEFLVEADGSSLPVALASMTAKLARELCMQRLNAFFQSHRPDLRPTAGYYGDASRFLRETKDVRGKLGIENHALIRAK